MAGAEIVTLLFTDLVGSTELLDRLGEEAADELRRAHFDLLRDAVGSHGGSEVKNLGDGLMAVFGSAVDGVACAVAIQRAVSAHNSRPAAQELSLRVGLHLGEPIRTENDYFGTPVVVAKRLCDRARGGQILASQLVADLVGSRRKFRFDSVGALQLKGLADPIPAVEIDVKAAAGPNGRGAQGAQARRSSSALPAVSSEAPPAREAELKLLDAEITWSAAGQFRCWLLTGESGVGKTALAGEVLGRYRPESLTVLTARAHGFDEVVPYALWSRALDRQLRRMDAADVLELCGPFLDDLAGSLRSAAALLGSVTVPDSPSPSRLLDALTTVLANLAGRAPVAVFLDDVHRADESCWEALDHFAHQLVDDRLLVLAAGRDRELDDRPGARGVIERLDADGLLRRMHLAPLGQPDGDGRAARPGEGSGSPDVGDDPVALVATARHALSTGDVDSAIGALTAAVTRADLPEAHDLLGGLVFYANEDLVGCRRHWEAAFRGYRNAGDLRGAARCAIWLGEIQFSGFGHEAVGRGWLGRASRLVDQIGPCVERGYLELALVACSVRDVSALEASAARALELAMEYGDPDLEARALADSGLALVTQGRIREGFARLDQAMVPVTAGELADPIMGGIIFCAMLNACHRSGDARRAEEWSRLCEELVLNPSGGSQPVLHADCRIAYGSVLCNVGRWPEAEAELLRALGPAGTRYFARRAAAIAELAHLRILQGRLEEAAELLAPVEDSFAAVDVLARLHFARGDLALAVAVIDRGLGELVGDRLRAGRLLALLVEVELAQDDVEAAAAALARLTKCSQEAESPVLRAQAARAAGLVAARQGRPEVACEAFQTARRELTDQEEPVFAARISLEAAEVRAVTGDTAAAVTEARAALAVFERLGAARDADRAGAFLRSQGAAGRTRARNRATALGALSGREQEVLALLGQGLTNAEIAQRLYITAKTAEHHVGRILTKLGVRSRTEAAALAAVEGIAAG